MKGYNSILDIGPGFGQFVNACSRSGWFRSATAADIREASGLIKEPGVNYVTLDIRSLKVDATLQAEVVTCLEVIEHLTNAGLALAIMNLRKLALRRIIVTVPYYEETRPKFHLQSFTLSRLRTLFPEGDITLIAEKRSILWAMVVVDK